MFIQSENIKEILEYYALFNLISTPIILVGLGILYTKTNLLDQLNKFIDKFLLGSDVKKNDSSDSEKSTDSNSQEKVENDDNSVCNDEDKSWEKDKNYLTYIELFTGDSYTCVLNSVELRNATVNSTETAEWRLDNPFVGTIDSDGIFEAKKEGHTQVIFGDAIIYKITVKTVSPWVYEPFYHAVLFQESKEKAKTECIRKKSFVKKFKQMGNSVSFSRRYSYPKETFTLIFGKDNLTEHFLLTTDNQDAECEIKQGLNERMAILEFCKDNAPKNFSVWYRENNENGQNPIVNCIAFILQYEQQLYFGITKSWRQECTKEEIQANADMVIRPFYDFLPNYYSRALGTYRLKSLEGVDFSKDDMPEDFDTESMLTD